MRGWAGVQFVTEHKIVGGVSGDDSIIDECENANEVACSYFERFCENEHVARMHLLEGRRVSVDTGGCTALHFDGCFQT